MRFTAGQIVGRYVVESLLGEGGMGEVYRARDSKLERSVALKVLRNDAEGSSEDWEHAVMRMQREAQAVAALSHPGIVAIYDIGEHEGAPFIAMELVGGQPLRDLIGKDVPLETRLRILLDVARALGAAHDAGFVHRDIKPENILVRQDGAAKVLDFGIARRTSRNMDYGAATIDIHGATVDIHGATIDAALVGRGATDGQGAQQRQTFNQGMTAEGALVGTPAYMSPEQLRGEPVDARSDQFAWGVVAYELLSGKHPFQAEKGAIGLLAAILGHTPAPLADAPEGMAIGVMRALEKEPEKRWASMQEIALHSEACIMGFGAKGAEGDPKPQLFNSGGDAGSQQEVHVSPSQTGPTKTTTVRTSRGRWLIAPILAVAALTAVVAFAFRGRSAPVVAPLVVPSATPVPTVTAVTDLPLPASTNATAIAEYRQGLQNIRDARWTAAATAFQHARTADPGMAAAHLRFSMLQFSYDVTSARAAYRKAQALRSALSERDADFLHALEPLILREPSDYRDAAKRLEQLVAQRPGDAELIFWYSRMIYHVDMTLETLNRVIELNDRCVQLDPQYGDCWQTKASALAMKGQQDEASKTVDECIKMAENSVDCLLDKIDFDSRFGRCNAVVESTQRLKTKDPAAINASILFSQGLYFAGEPEPVVRAAFVDADARARAAGRDFEGRMALLMSATDFGEIPEALEHAQFMARSMNAPNSEMEMALYFFRGALYSEAGKTRDAGTLADEYFVAKALHPASSKKLQLDPTVFMHSLHMRAGTSSPTEYRQLRAAWLDKQTAVAPLDRALIWLAAYAIPTYSVESAREALAHAPENWTQIPMDGAKYTKPLLSFRGRTLALAGEYAQAIPILENALNICTSADPLPWYMPQVALLGRAREATGDKPGACQAYMRVLERWGKSKQSDTVKDVVKRAKKLRCASFTGQTAR